MNILHKTIQSLSKEEVINYKLYTNRTRKDHERKDIVLFDLLKKSQNDDANDTNLITKIYSSETAKNTFHRLKSRLLQEIDNSTVQFYFHKTDTHYIYSEISLYKTYVQKSEWAIALYHLKKAEVKAIETYDYLLLDVIYTEFISLSVQYGEIGPNDYLLKRKQNAVKLNDIRSLDDALATTMYELKRTQNFSKTNNQKILILNQAIRSANSKQETKTNIVFKSKLYSAVSNLLLMQKDYAALEQYAVNTYKDFTKHHLFSKQNHNTKLQMLMYICNTLFVNKKHTQALEYAQKLKIAMSEFDNLLFDNYVFFYYNSLANNYSVIDSNKTVEVLNEAKTVKAIKQHHTNLGYVYLNLAGAYFDLGQYKLALKNIMNLYNHTAYENISDAFKINIRITEIILRIETHDLAYASKLIKLILKEYKQLLLLIEHKQDFDFLKLAELLIQKYKLERNKHALELIKIFQKNPYNQVSTTIVNYNTWLQNKYGV